MAKLTLVLFVALIFSFGFLDTAKSEDEEVHESAEGGEERAGYARPVAVPRISKIASRPAAPVGPPGQPGQLGNNQCYTCIDCAEAHEYQLKQCPIGLYPLKTGCVTYAEKYQQQNEAIVRGCVSERGNCADIRKALGQLHVTLLSCHECQGDKCNANGATRAFTDLTMAFMTLLVTPLVAKITLS